MDLTEQVRRIDLPSLVICGEEDKMTPPALSQEIAADLRGAQACFIKSAGHMVMMENPESFNQSLIAFAESLPARKL